MTERRYNDEEVAAIFERAAKTEQTTPTVAAEGKGLTLTALQEIGREVGISAEAISHAAQALDQTGRPSVRKFMGVPIGVGRTIEFERQLADSDWERLVADLRTTFNARGTIRYDGPFRQWTNGNLQALLEPTPKGHRLRLQTTKGDSQGLMRGGAVALGAMVATSLALALRGRLAPGSLTGLALLALIGLGMFAAGALSVSSWARRRRAQFEGIIARLGGQNQ